MEAPFAVRLILATLSILVDGEGDGQARLERLQPRITPSAGNRGGPRVGQNVPISGCQKPRPSSGFSYEGILHSIEVPFAVRLI
jgi:hypothetical protein